MSGPIRHNPSNTRLLERFSYLQPTRVETTRFSYPIVYNCVRLLFLEHRNNDSVALPCCCVELRTSSFLNIETMTRFSYPVVYNCVRLLFLEHRNNDSVTLFPKNSAKHSGVRGEAAALTGLSLNVVNNRTDAQGPDRIRVSFVSLMTLSMQ